MQRRRAWLAFALLAPLCIWLIVTIVIPIAYLVQLSFTTTGIFGTAAEFAGLANFQRILGSERFWQSARNTLVWVIGNGLVQVTLAFTVARLLYRQTAFTRFMQIWIILPWVIPGVAAVIIWRWMLSGIGIVNYGIQSVGLVDAPISFFAQPSIAMATTIVVNSW